MQRNKWTKVVALILVGLMVLSLLPMAFLSFLGQ
jgi:hypothetical protein